MENQNEIKFIRLVTGEDIIAEIQPVDEKNCIIINPMKILYASTGTGHMSISLMQWVFMKISTHQQFDLPLINILTSTIPTESLTTYYLETVDQFFNKTNDSEEDEEEYFEGEDEYLDEENGLEMLKDMLKSISDKRKLH